jgi:hypothetical protein
MAVALKVAGRHPDAGALLERLENSEGAPWPQLRAAVEAIAGHPELALLPPSTSQEES